MFDMIIFHYIHHLFETKLGNMNMVDAKIDRQFYYKEAPQLDTMLFQIQHHMHL